MKDTKWLSRTELLIGRENVSMLNNSHVLIVGMGGVGSFAAEFICRAGVGEMTIIDGDVVEASNRNRQLPAMSSTEGLSKAGVMAGRLMDISPELRLHVVTEFIRPEMVADYMAVKYDYIIDAIDSITPKITFLKEAVVSGHKIVSSMGAGGRLDPTQIEVADISKSYNCPFAQQVRKQLKGIGIYKGFKAVFSSEMPDQQSLILTDGTNFKKSAYGTISYLPAAFGGVVASVVLRDLLQKRN